MFLNDKQVLGIFILLCARVELSHSAHIISVKYDDTHTLQHKHYYVCGSGTVLKCEVVNDNIGKLESAHWVKYNNGKSQSVTEPVHLDSTLSPITIPYTLEDDGLYSCQYNVFTNLKEYAFNLTVDVQGSAHTCSIDPSAPMTTTISSTFTTSTTSTTTSTTTSQPVESSTSSIGPHFKGLNPLIYTVVSALLLGVLTLVSIITCWLRSRKNTRLRTLLPQESPQDYLDYIQEGQFTPLTTSEFIASLRERPPTYLESENIERQIQDDNESSESTSPPPPLPPRNPNSTWTPLEEDDSAREPLGNLSFVEGEITTSTSDQSHVNEDLRDITLSFLLNESSYQNPPPPHEEREDDDICTDTETTNLLVGVIPSLDAVV